MSVENVGSSGEGQRPIATSGGRPNATLIGVLVVVALFVVFFLQNGDPSQIEFLFFEKRTTIRWSLLVALLLGVLLDRIFSIWWRRRGRRKEV
jgi:uncharacterized integral membrane protein